MYPTRQGWAVAALTVVLAVLAVVSARPLALVGAALVGAWLLAHQYRFTRDLERTVDALSIAQSPARTGARTGDEIPVTLSASCEAETGMTLEVVAGLPVAAGGPDRLAVVLEPDVERADCTRTIGWPVAGRHSFEAATVTATDGLFRETLTMGPTPTVTVEPPSPRTIHVGEGGDRIAPSYGSHATGRTGSGTDLAELREYVPGDTEAEIDWKATARHSTPYVREYEAESDRRTLLIVDHRAAMGDGPRTETKLETLREVALAIAGTARRLGDPLGLITVGDDGITGRLKPAPPTANYDPIRRRLLSLEPTATAESTSVAAVSGRADSTEVGRADGVSEVSRRSGDAVASTASTAVRGDGAGELSIQRRPTPTDAHRSLADLEGTTDTFARTLLPFYTDREVYRERIADDPLYGAVHRGTADTDGAMWTVICTDDSRPAELREAVALARRGENRVMVLLAPSVLYEPGGLADVERAYDRYVEFEEFRRELAQLPGVTALEVGPVDRLSAVLEAGRAGGGTA